jgi:hypothetical protein
MVESLERVGRGRQLGELSWRPDPVVQAIVSTWPAEVDASRALAAGVPAPDELDRIVQEAADAAARS